MPFDVRIHGKLQRTSQLGSQAEDGWEIGNSSVFFLFKVRILQKKKIDSYLECVTDLD